MWARIDVNGNGYVSLAEVTKVFHHMFLFKLNPNQTISGSSGRTEGRTISWLMCSDG